MKQRFAFYTFLAMCVACSASAEARRPNIVLMLADNVGYGELGAYGGGVLRGARTPRLDKLAREGIRFTNFNVEVECTPSRSALLTGRLPVRSGTSRASNPGLPGGLAPWEVTLAEVLGESGYETALFGKWHLGDSPGRYPTDQGFDRWWGFPFSTSVATFRSRVGFDPAAAKAPHLLEGEKGKPVRQQEPYTLENRPLIDEQIAKKSAAYIQDRAQSESPFFLLVSWSLLHNPYLPHPDFEGRAGNGPLADSVVEHDHRVGQVIDAIDDAGIADDTVVLYVSDNGPHAADYPVTSSSGPFRGYLGSAYEGAIRTPLLLRWPGQVEAGRVTNEIVSLVDLFPSLAQIGGAKIPDDRQIDGLDMSAFWRGEREQSPRESVLIFSGRTLLAVKWRRFKMFMTGDDPSPQNRAWRKLWAPQVFNVEQDPREEVDIAMANLWLLQPVMRDVYRFVATLQDEGLILPGGDKPGPAKVEIPFFPSDEIEQSLEAMRQEQSSR